MYFIVLWTYDSKSFYAFSFIPCLTVHWKVMRQFDYYQYGQFTAAIVYLVLLHIYLFLLLATLVFSNRFVSI